MMYRQNRSLVNVCSGIAILIAFIWLCMPLAEVRASAYQNWTGLWTTTYGALNLKQEGRIVSGTYSVDKELRGEINGIIEDEWGFTLSGTWNEGDASGTFKFSMTDQDDHFQGWWDSADNSWNGTRNPIVKQQEMDVLNNSPYPITALFICPAGSENWQEVLGAIELGNGKQKKVIFNVDNKEHNWDIKIVDASGHFTVFQNQTINDDFTSINYYYKDGGGQIRFAVG